MPVGGGRRAEGLRDAASGADALAGLARQAVEVGIAGRDLAPQRGHPEHRLGEVVIVEADGPQHGAVGCALDAGGGDAAAGI